MSVSSDRSVARKTSSGANPESDGRDGGESTLEVDRNGNRRGMGA